MRHNDCIINGAGLEKKFFESVWRLGKVCLFLKITYDRRDVTSAICSGVSHHEVSVTFLI